MNILTVVRGDTLDFELIIRQENGKRLTLSDGDQYFFRTAHRREEREPAPDKPPRPPKPADETEEADGEKPACTRLDITQAGPQFKIDNITLEPGSYRFAAGVIYADGTIKTVFRPEESWLKVTPGLEDCACRP